MAWQKAKTSFVKPDNSVALFKNTERRGEKDPEYKGGGQINGREYWASAWVNESKKDGRKYLSVKFKPKQDSYKRSDYEEAKVAPRDIGLDDEIPF